MQLPYRSKSSPPNAMVMLTTQCSPKYYAIPFRLHDLHSSFRLFTVINPYPSNEKPRHVNLDTSRVLRLGISHSPSQGRVLIPREVGMTNIPPVVWRGLGRVRRVHGVVHVALDIQQISLVKRHIRPVIRWLKYWLGDIAGRVVK